MIVVCGNFAKNDLKIVNGQVTKTRNILNIVKNLPNEKVKTIDTSKNKLSVFLEVIFFYFLCSSFLLCVSRNGTKILVPILCFFKKIKKRTNLIFFCIGTCPFPRDYSPNLVLTKKELKIGKKLSCFNYVCPETNTMKNELESVFKLRNIIVFKNYQIDKEIICHANSTNDKFVFFSRISHEKNIEGLFNAIDELENVYNIKILIDFYGPIEESICNYFVKQISERNNCKYKGVIDSNESIKTLSNYKALIFTTNCLEGTPGAIVDAAFANIPILSQTFWASKELIEDSGIGLVGNNISHNIINFLSKNKNDIDAIKKNCYSFATSYSFKEAIDKIKVLIYN